MSGAPSPPAHAERGPPAGHTLRAKETKGRKPAGLQRVQRRGGLAGQLTISTALRKSLAAAAPEARRWMLATSAPPRSAARVTRQGSPPNTPMWVCTQVRAATWSSSPQLPLTSPDPSERGESLSPSVILQPETRQPRAVHTGPTAPPVRTGGDWARARCGRGLRNQSHPGARRPGHVPAPLWATAGPQPSKTDW